MTTNEILMSSGDPIQTLQRLGIFSTEPEMDRRAQNRSFKPLHTAREELAEQSRRIGRRRYQLGKDQGKLRGVALAAYEQAREESKQC
tara:strand:- start:4061 stop:4324 length:264 start_codon:yes stop_codon:yes gene_type:complete